MPPTRLSVSEQEVIYKTAISGMKALGLRSTPAHIEIILTNNGPKIIEIGARIGGYRARMYEYSLGIDLYQAAISTAQNKPLDLIPKLQQASTVIELFPETCGSFVAFDGHREIEQLASTILYKPQANAWRPDWSSSGWL